MLAGPDPIDVLSWRLSGRAHDAHPVEGPSEGHPKAGYANTFVRQMEQVLGTCLDRGVRVVTNAGGLNPTGLAERAWASSPTGSVFESPDRRWITGDDLQGRAVATLQAAGETFEHLDTGVTLADAGVGTGGYCQRLSRRVGDRHGPRRATPTW